MRRTARILVDQAHRQAWTCDLELAASINPANPADASYALMAQSAVDGGFELSINETAAITAELLADVDVFVLPHASEDEWEKTVGYGSPKLSSNEIDALEQFVAMGGGLLILGETEQQKYGNNFAQLASRFGVKISNATVQDPVSNFNKVASWPKPELPRLTRADLNFQVQDVFLYRAATLEIETGTDAEVFLKSSETAMPASAALGAAVWHGKGRVVVLADSDLFGDDSVSDGNNLQLWLNIVGWLGNAKAAMGADSKKSSSWLESDLDWRRLTASVEALRPMQQKDGAIDLESHDIAKVNALVEDVLVSIAGLAPKFEHQSEY